MFLLDFSHNRPSIPLTPGVFSSKLTIIKQEMFVMFPSLLKTPTKKMSGTESANKWNFIKSKGHNYVENR